LTPNQNYCAYLNILEIPQSLMRGLKPISPALVDSLQEKFKSGLCYVQLYKDVIFTIVSNSETIIDKKKAELRKELIGIEARKNFVKHFQDKKEYALLIKDAIRHSNPEDEQKIRTELRQLEDFHSSIYHLCPEKITS
ncbi:MAG: hypothetical protein H0T84_09160, partial [Tatlockia sp.]|nr:hypothetical protein [Tatlockia sp.]